VRLYPALDVHSSSDLLLALVDDFSPTAVEQRDEAMRVFFSSSASRDAASAELRSAGYRTDPLDVSDEDWALRSQEHLTPVVVGRIAVLPDPAAQASQADTVPPDLIQVVIQPSMGFGTGHHETTRLCLEALQTVDLTNAFVLDVGTGSGVLAIAADLLGATRALGIDNDPDAIHSARENLLLNPRARRTSVALADLMTTALPPADVVTANLTGALLVRAAGVLAGAVRPGGTLILGGILATERDTVRGAFGEGVMAGDVMMEGREAEWILLALRRRSEDAPPRV
jgi:ribosomal protein L11 methyltransferase